MITVHICSQDDSNVVTRNIDPESKSQFDNELLLLFREACGIMPRFLFDFDTSDANDQQKQWVNDFNS